MARSRSSHEIEIKPVISEADLDRAVQAVMAQLGNAAANSDKAVGTSGEAVSDAVEEGVGESSSVEQYREIAPPPTPALSEEERARVIEQHQEEWEQREALFLEKLARRWRPWATRIGIIPPDENMSHPMLYPASEIVACTGCGLTAARSTARRSFLEVRDCPRCGGNGSVEWCDRRAHLTRARKSWECESCQARIAPKTFYVVLGEWPEVRRLCVECTVEDSQRGEGGGRP